MTVRLIYDRIRHHATHSGYDLLAKHICAKPLHDGWLYAFTSRIDQLRLDALPAWGTPWYSRVAQRRELTVCARSALLPNRTLYHWLYAENDLRICSQWKWRWNNRFVGSFHQPPEYLEHHIEDKSYIRGLDAIVVMSRSQIPYMSQFVPEERVFCVPHGVAIEHWKPDRSVPRWEAPTFLFVGVWLRDIEMLKATICACAERGLPANFRIVTSADRVAGLQNLPHTTVMTGIPEEQLLLEYRRAHALFLPLQYSTANNVLLEAMACGTGVVSTRVGGTAEYLSDESGLLVSPGDVDAAVEAIGKFCKSPDFVEVTGARARARALAFSWESIGALQDRVYQTILRGGERPGPVR